MDTRIIKEICWSLQDNIAMSNLSQGQKIIVNTKLQKIIDIIAEEIE